MAEAATLEKIEQPSLESEYDVVDPAAVEEQAPPESAEPKQEPAIDAAETTDDKEAVETATEGEQQDESAETSSGLSDDLLGLAQKHGFSKEEAEAFGDEPRLRRALAAQDRVIADLGKRAMAARPQPVEATPEKKPLAPPSESDLRLDPEFVDERVAAWSDKVLAKLAERDSKIAELEKKFSTTEQTQQQANQAAEARRAQETAQKLDTFFNGLGEEYTEFGKGSIRDISPAAALKRNELWQMMNALNMGDMQISRQPSNFEELQVRALNSLYPEKLKVAARKEVEKKVAARKASSIARPTSKNNKRLPPLEAAGAFADAFYRERAVDDDNDTDV